MQEQNPKSPQDQTQTSSSEQLPQKPDQETLKEAQVNPAAPKLPSHFQIFMRMWDKAHEKRTEPVPYPIEIRANAKTGKPYAHWKNRHERRVEEAKMRKLLKRQPTQNTLTLDDEEVKAIENAKAE